MEKQVSVTRGSSTLRATPLGVTCACAEPHIRAGGAEWSGVGRGHQVCGPHPCRGGGAQVRGYVTRDYFVCLEAIALYCCCHIPYIVVHSEALIFFYHTLYQQYHCTNNTIILIPISISTPQKTGTWGGRNTRQKKRRKEEKKRKKRERDVDLKWRKYSSNLPGR